MASEGVTDWVMLWPDTGDPDWPRESGPELALHAVALVGGRAVATERAWRDYQSANAANDRNGTYNTESIVITDAGMAYQWEHCPGDDPDTVFIRVEADTDDGQPLYLIDGPWVTS